jgi:uncharacterized membrane protein
VDLTYVHLLLNHFPVIGTIIGFGLFVLGLAGKSNDLKRASLVVFLGISLVTIATYVSGNGAEENICKADQPGDPCTDKSLSKTLIENHESAALVALAFMELTGALSWLGLWQFRRLARVPRWNLTAVLVFSGVTLLLMANAANLGGDIRHPEVRAPGTAAAATAAVPPAGDPPFARAVGEFVTDATWIWPSCETLHFIGLCLLFGITAMVDLRVLGMMRAVPFQALHRLLPWGVLGFGVNLVTGLLFFVADPDQYTHSAPFQWKIVLIMLAGLNLLYFTIFDTPWDLHPGEDAPAIAKFVAASALFLVVGVMFCGRMLPFLGDSF